MLFAPSNRILDEVSVSRETFAQDPKLQIWVLYHLQVIGERREA